MGMYETTNSRGKGRGYLVIEGFPGPIIIRSPPHGGIGHGEAAEAGVVQIAERVGGDLRHQLLHHRTPGLPLRCGSFLFAAHRHLPVCPSDAGVPDATAAGGARAAAGLLLVLDRPGLLEDPTGDRSEGPERAETAQSGGSGGDQEGAEGERVGAVHLEDINGSDGIKP